MNHLRKLTSGSAKKHSRRGRSLRRRALAGEPLEARCLLTTNTIMFDPTGAGGSADDFEFNSLDWLPGNLLAENSTDALEAFVGGGVQMPYDNIYQARLGSFLDENSVVVPGTGLGTDYEVTAVARFTIQLELVQPVGNQSIAAFSLAPVQSVEAFGFEVWLDDTPDANDELGTGFRDGELIMTVDSIDPATFAAAFISNTANIVNLDGFGPIGNAALTTTGAGSVHAEATVDFTDAGFFLNQSEILRVIFDTNNNLNFTATDPSISFLGITPFYGDNNINGVPDATSFNQEDFQFQADGSSSFVEAGEIRGFKWHDLNADGIWDDNEPGLDGWTIELLQGMDVIASTTTGDNPDTPGTEAGFYSFKGLEAGEYTVREVLADQPGWFQSFPSAHPDPPGTHTVNITPSQVVEGEFGVEESPNFGNWTTATKSGVKFEDLDADGSDREAGEPGLDNWTIFVDYDDDTMLDADEPFAVTAGDGSYTIEGIVPGTWKVREVPQPDWTQSFPHDPDYHEDIFTSSAALTDNNFGNWTTATKRGTKYNDFAEDGIFNAPDVVLSGWVITAFADDGDGILQPAEIAAGAADSDTTDVRGNYTLTLDPGDYIVVETLQTDWFESPDLGTTEVNPNALGGFGKHGHAVTLTSREDHSGNDFANFQSPPEVTIEKTAVSDVVSIGQPACYTITVSNDGISPAYNVVVSDQLPNDPDGNGTDDLEWTVTAGPTQGTAMLNVGMATDDLLTWNIGTLAGDASVSITVCADTSPLGVGGDPNTDAVIPADLFQLDGNAEQADDPGGLGGDDWDNVLLGGGGSATSHTGVITEVEFETIFTQGGSKDVRDVSQWKHTDGSVPDKDDLTNAYAASYLVDTDGDMDDEQVIYFGADRFANDGDAAMGFWFFQNQITTVDTTTPGTFSDVHELGDVLVISDFSQGGVVSTIQIYEWVGDKNGDDDNLIGDPAFKTNGPLQLIFTGAPSLADGVFAIVNADPETAPWDYEPKAGVAGTFPMNSFFEGGINMDRFGLAGCFASFLAETRSSTSTTAQLKDFILGQINTCELVNKATVTWEFPSGVPAPDSPAMSEEVTIELTGGSAAAVAANSAEATGPVALRQVRDRADRRDAVLIEPDKGLQLFATDDIDEKDESPNLNPQLVDSLFSRWTLNRRARSR